MYICNESSPRGLRLRPFSNVAQLRLCIARETSVQERHTLATALTASELCAQEVLYVPFAANAEAPVFLEIGPCSMPNDCHSLVAVDAQSHGLHVPSVMGHEFTLLPLFFTRRNIRDNTSIRPSRDTESAPHESG
jgi:hypothetical protein